MVAVVHDPILEQSLRDQRVASEDGRFDEVWEGVYYMNAMPNDEHRELVSRFVYVLQDIPDWSARRQKILDALTWWKSTTTFPSRKPLS